MAMNKCAVIGCKSKEDAFNTTVTFHRVTRNKAFLPLWQIVVKLKSNCKHSKICSLHFQEKDFVVNKGKRCLKVHAIPSFNVVEGAHSTNDEDENESLSKLKKSIKKRRGTSIEGHRERRYHCHQNSDSDDNGGNPYLTELFPAVKCCNRPTHTVGVQTRTRTKKEIALQAKVRMLDLRLRRRDAKISYMQTVLDMVKKHIKGTDMEYTLCSELENIPEPTESSFENKRKISYSDEIKTSWLEEPPSEEEDGCMFVEVVHSSNLNA